MSHLGAGRGAVPMYGVSENPEPWHNSRLELELVGERTAVSAHGTIRNRRHPNATSGHGRMMFHEHLRRNASTCATFVGGGLDETITQRERPNPNRTER